MSEAPTIRIGTRGSPLARWQAEWVAGQLTSHRHTVELVPIRTRGDVQQTGPVETIGGLGVFTRELQVALLEGAIDLAVHSLKDLPTETTPGLELLAVPERGPVADVLISKGKTPFSELRQGAIVATGSLRRRSQLLHRRSDLQLSAIRGNVDTRIRKLHEQEFDAIVLAEAGLHRLGLDAEITERFSLEFMLPAVGQGALGIEGRSDDTTIRAVLAPLDHPDTHSAVMAERSLLHALRGGCLAPIGAHATVNADGLLTLRAVVLSVNGRQRIEATGSDAAASAVALGLKVAGDLLSQGAGALIDALRDANKP